MVFTVTVVTGAECRSWLGSGYLQAFHFSCTNMAPSYKLSANLSVNCACTELMMQEYLNVLILDSVHKIKLFITFTLLNHRKHQEHLCSHLFIRLQDSKFKLDPFKY